jgi:actin-related protein
MDNDEMKQIMFNNIVLAGGTSMMEGFSYRIEKDLSKNISNTKLNVISENMRNLSTWIGASMISSMSTFNKLLITRESLSESGENRVGIFKKIF